MENIHNPIQFYIYSHNRVKSSKNNNHHKRKKVIFMFVLEYCFLELWITLLCSFGFLSFICINIRNLWLCASVFSFHALILRFYHFWHSSWMFTWFHFLKVTHKLLISSHVCSLDWSSSNFSILSIVINLLDSATYKRIIFYQKHCIHTIFFGIA